MQTATDNGLDVPAILDRTQGHNVLADLAHEINVRLQKADDHRLSAALKLAEAKAECERVGITFKAWVAKEIHLGYVEANKLALIGAQPDPAQALEDHRRRGAERMQKARAARPVVSRDTTPAIAPPPRGKAAVAARVREAIAALSGLPPPAEVVGYLRGTDEAILVGENLSAAVTWLMEFSDIWEEQSHAEAAE